MALSYPIPRILASAALAAFLAAFLAAGEASAAPLTIREEWQAAPEGKRLEFIEQSRTAGRPGTIPFLVELMHFPDMKVKMAAANALRLWGPDAYPALFSCLEERETAWLAEGVLLDQERRVVPFLVGRLGSPLPTQRARAASLLGKIRDADAVPPLLPLLMDSVREVRIRTILALGEAQDDRAIGPLLALFAEGNPLISEYIIQALEGYGWQAAKRFREALRSDNPRVRTGTVQVMRRLRVPESLPDLVTALSDGSPQVRMASVAALGQFKGQAAAEALLMAMRDTDDEVAEAAVRNLGLMGPEITPLLLARLDDVDPRYRRNIVIVLRQTGGAGALPSFVQLLNDPDEAVRTYAVTALMEVRDKRAIKPLVDRLKIETEIQWLIAFALQSMADECADELLSAVGNDQFCYTRNIILLRMGERAMDVLLERALRGAGQSRITAIALLGQLGDPKVAPELEKLLAAPGVGLPAAGALTRLKGPGWKILLDRAHGPEGVERRNALTGIGGADTGAAPQLLAALGDPDPAVRDAVSRALDRAGAPIVPLLAEKLGTLPDEGFEAACGVLCRISDPGAAGALSRLLSPKPGSVLPFDQERFDRLRVAYAVRGGLSNLREQMQTEMTGGPPVGR